MAFDLIARAAARTTTSRLDTGGLVTPEMFNPAAGSGGDDSAAIAAAHAFAVANNKVVGLTPGKTYIFNGPSLTGAAFRLVSGARGTGFRTNISGCPRVNIAAGIYLYDDSSYCPSVLIEGISFSGGAGVYRNTRTAATTALAMPTVTRCFFDGYSKCAIAHSSSDWPYWKISENWFNAASAVGTCGVALSGLTDNCIVSRNAFAAGQVAVKVNAGNNCHIHHNDFIVGDVSHASPVPCVTVFIVPAATAINAGQGMTIRDNKFGNERYSPTIDYRIFIGLDTGSGSFGERMPDVATTAGATFTSGITIEGNLFNGYGAVASNAVVRSMTPNMSIKIRGNTLAATPPAYILESALPPSYSSNSNYIWDVRENSLNLTRGAALVAECNYSEAIRAEGNVSGLVGNNSFRAGTCGYQLISRFPTRNGSGTSTRAFSTDPFGGSDAVTVTLGATGGLTMTGTGEGAAVQARARLFLEFDYAMVGSTAGDVACYLAIGGTTVWNGVVRCESTLWRHACLELPIVSAGSGDAVLSFYANTAAAAGVQMAVARSVLYQAAAPVNVLPTRGRQDVAMAAAGSTTGLAELLVNTTSGTIASHTVVLPTAPKDGDRFALATYGAITALTVTGTTTSSPATLAAGGAVTWHFVGSAARWFKVG